MRFYLKKSNLLQNYLQNIRVTLDRKRTQQASITQTKYTASNQGIKQHNLAKIIKAKHQIEKISQIKQHLGFNI